MLLIIIIQLVSSQFSGIFSPFQQFQQFQRNIPNRFNHPIPFQNFNFQKNNRLNPLSSKISNTQFYDVLEAPLVYSSQSFLFQSKYNNNNNNNNLKTISYESFQRIIKDYENSVDEYNKERAKLFQLERALARNNSDYSLLSSSSSSSSSSYSSSSSLSSSLSSSFSNSESFSHENSEDYDHSTPSPSSSSSSFTSTSTSTSSSSSPSPPPPSSSSLLSETVQTREKVDNAWSSIVLHELFLLSLRPNTHPQPFTQFLMARQFPTGAAFAKVMQRAAMEAEEGEREKEREREKEKEREKERGSEKEEGIGREGIEEQQRRREEEINGRNEYNNNNNNFNNNNNNNRKEKEGREGSEIEYESKEDEGGWVAAVFDPVKERIRVGFIPHNEMNRVVQYIPLLVIKVSPSVYTPLFGKNGRLNFVSQCIQYDVDWEMVDERLRSATSDELWNSFNSVFTEV